jgi:hypothetical protein
VRRAALRVTWYRFHTTFGRHWGGYLTLILLVGLVGGLSMGALSGGRRTLASPQVYTASTNPYSFGIGTGLLGVTSPTTGYNPRTARTLEQLPHVDSGASIEGLNMVALETRGNPIPLNAQAGNGSGSIDGAYFTKDKVSVIKGRMPEAGNPHEFAVNAIDAQGLGLHIGQVVPFGIYTDAQTEQPGFGTRAVAPYRRIDETLVGIVEDPTTVAADQVDTGNSLEVFTPALTRQLLSCCVNYQVTGLRVDGGAPLVDQVEQEAQRALPPGAPLIITTTTAVGVAKAQRSVKPLAIALGVFGGITGLVSLLVGGQLIARQLGFDAGERQVLRALGADSVGTVLDGLVGMVGAIVSGAVLAVVVAVALSPLAPLGVIRPVYPDRGVHWDWTVLGTGVAVLAIGLSLTAVAISARQAPERVQRRRRRQVGSESTAAGVAAGWGLPVPAVEGIRFALDPGRGSTAVPVRSVIFGTVLAVWVVVTTVTFGASLNWLISHPDLYGWNWDVALIGGSGSGDIPSADAAGLLAGDHSVASWSGVYFADLKIDGQTVPVLGATPGAPVQPPILSGHDLEGPGQIVLGPDTLAQLGKHVGDTVDVDNGRGAPGRLTVVGTATMPSVGTSGELHLEMGSGAVLPYRAIPASERNPFADPQTGPEAILVRFRPGTDEASALASLRRIGEATSTSYNFGVFVSKVQRPAEIVNYRAMGSTPVLLGVSLAAGAMVALGLTLIASVRRRRRDLAVLKTLGFTGRQLSATVAWQSTVSVLFGVVVGLPLGIIAGRWLWDLFAAQINAVPSPSVPVVWIVVIAGGALVLGNLVAAVPGRLAARTPTALVLRTD